MAVGHFKNLLKLAYQVQLGHAGSWPRINCRDWRGKWSMAAQPHVLDVRSVAVLRAFLGAFVALDVFWRMDQIGGGQAALAWYTSTPDALSVLHDDDTPHRAALHRLAFHRGTAAIQQLLLSATFVSAVCVCVGWHCSAFGAAPMTLWALVVTMHGRCEVLVDGADNFLRALLVWLVMLPSGRVWSVDAMLRRRSLRRRRQLVGASAAEQRAPPDMGMTIAGAAPLGLTLQIGFLYWGTLVTRVSGRAWWWPDLSAVCTVMASGFATRPAAALIAASPFLCRAMTLGATVVEGLAPLLLLLGRCVEATPGRHTVMSWPPPRYVPALMLFSLHLGILATMRLPNFCVLCMGVCVVWTPSVVWDWIAVTHPHGASDQMPPRRHPPSLTRSCACSPLLVRAALAFMLLNCAGEWGLINKFDNGDIGESLRWTQVWVMFGPSPPTTYVNVFVSASVAPAMHVDVLRALHLKDWGAAAELTRGEHGAAAGSELTALPQTAAQQWAQAVARERRSIGQRFEKGVVDRWGRRLTGERPLEDRLRRLLQVWCAEGAAARRAAGRPTPRSLSFFVRGVEILPAPPLGAAGSAPRFARYPKLDLNVTQVCHPYLTGLVNNAGGGGETGSGEGTIELRR